MWACLRTSRPGGTAIGAVQLVKLTSEGLFFAKTNTSLAQTPPDAAAYTQAPMVTASRSERGGKILFRLLAYRPLSPIASEQALHDQCTTPDADFECTTTKCWFALSLTRDPANLDQSSCQLTVGQGGAEPLGDTTLEAQREPQGDGLREPTQDSTPAEATQDREGSLPEPPKEQTPEALREVVADGRDGGSPEQSVDNIALDKATPDKVTPDKVTPDKVTPDKVTPDKITPDSPPAIPPWASSASSLDHDVSRGIAVDGQGNVIVVGTFKKTIKFPTGPSQSIRLTAFAGGPSTDIFVAKLSPSGDWLWAKSVGTLAEDFVGGVVVDGKGNITLIGDFSGTISFGGKILGATGSTDVFVAQIKGDGSQWLWATKLGSFDKEEGLGIALDGLDNVIVTGSFAGTVKVGNITLSSKKLASGMPSQDMFVAKLDSAGKWLWAKGAGSVEADAGNAVAADAQGNVYVVGRFRKTATFGSASLTAGGSTEAFVAKLSVGGLWVWAKQTKGTNSGTSNNAFNIATGITVDTKNQPIILGAFQNTLTFSGLSSLGMNQNVFSQLFVAKMSPSGTWLWAKQSDGSARVEDGAIGVSTQGDIFVASSCANTATFGGLSASPKGGSDACVLKLDTNGVWLSDTRGGDKSNDTATGIAVTSQGSVFVTGTYLLAPTFGSSTLPAAAGLDVFVWKVQ